MRFVVKKFGGTSVGNIDRILEVAKKVAAARDQGEQGRGRGVGHGR